MGWIFFAFAVLLSARASLGRVLVERLRSGRGVDPRFEEFTERVTEELAALREDVNELQERMDFTERALTAARRSDALPGPREA